MRFVKKRVIGRECSNKESKSDNKQHASSFIAEAYIKDVSVFYSKTSDSDEDIWLADSGASMHMTYRQEWFTTLDALSDIDYVKVADNKVLRAAGKEAIVICEQVQGKTFIRELRNVLPVSELKRNLFSIGKINDKEILFHSCKLYYEVCDFFCKTCVIGKQTRKPHSAVKSASNFKPGEKIHTDVCGPINIESPRGLSYFSLFKDECTSFRNVNFLRHKSGVFEKFREYGMFVQVQTGNKIKELRSDNGREYTSEHIRKHTAERGIGHELPSPSTEKNSIWS